MGFFSFLRRSNTAPTGRPSPFPHYSGGDGRDLKAAVVVHADTSILGIPAEYAYISDIHGERGVDWDLKLQSLLHENDISYDAIEIETAKGDCLTYYFDISQFFGK